MFKYEMHCHTSEGSACSHISASDMADFYKKAGYTGLFITDHFFNGNTAAPRDLPWRERVDFFCLGYENAKKRGDEIGLQVFFGFENSYSGTDFITLGLDKAWLYEHENCHKLPAPEYCDLVHKSGGYVIQAHPFREEFYIDMIRLLPRHVDAVEVYNGGNTDFQNEMAHLYVQHYSLKAFCGTDNHFGFRKTLTALELPQKINDVKGLMSLVKSGNYRPVQYCAREENGQIIMTEK